MTAGAMTEEARLLHEAAAWATTLRFGEPSDSDRQGFEHWRAQSAAHRAAWARAEAVFADFSPARSDAGRAALRSLSSQRRRRLGGLGLLLVAAPATILVARRMPWQAWTADVDTATGERRAVMLPDGSALVLNTASAVDLRFDAAGRRVALLAGEILVTTRPDPLTPARPFVVDTPCGPVRALGTRFTVRLLSPDRCRVGVLEQAVEVVAARSGRTVRLAAGRQFDFGVDAIGPDSPLDPAAAAWEQGMLYARNMPLADVVAELGRYRHGVLRCDPAVAGMTVSGAISVADTEAGLRLIARSLPVRIVRRTRYWVTIEARGT